MEEENTHLAHVKFETPAASGYLFSVWSEQETVATILFIWPPEIR